VLGSNRGHRYNFSFDQFNVLVFAKDAFFDHRVIAFAGEPKTLDGGRGDGNLHG
jgi:hypothetical protein